VIRGVKMIWTVWNNGSFRGTGAGYGFKISYENRLKHFQKSWTLATVILTGDGETIEVTSNVAKKSFRAELCGELIKKEFGIWLIGKGFFSWPKGQPSKFKVLKVGDRRFKIVELLN